MGEEGEEGEEGRGVGGSGGRRGREGVGKGGGRKVPKGAGGGFEGRSGEAGLSKLNILPPTVRFEVVYSNLLVSCLDK